MIVSKEKMYSYLKEVTTPLTQKEKKKYFIKSIYRFVKYLYQEEKLISFYKEKELTKLKLEEYRNKVYSYLEMIASDELSSYNREHIFENHISEIGIFMSTYFDFKLYSGYGKYISLVFLIGLGALTDYLLYYLLDYKTYFLFSLLGMVVFSYRLIKVSINNKSYGD